MRFVFVCLALVATLITGCSATPTPMSGMAGMNTGQAPAIPAGKAYANGEEIYFIHTEVSDADVAKVLTDMMRSPVLVVPALAQVPDAALANVYVFKNGPKGMGPLGFQPDVFDNPPDQKGYTPLRRIIFATWKNTQAAPELKSLAEVQAAESKGELTLEKSNVVVNMPFLSWKGGKR